jgi:hypothetical protein
MTTILGIQTNSDKGLESIVMVSDLQVSDDEQEAKWKIPRKIYIGENWAMGDTGGDDKDVRRMYGVLQGYKRYGSNDNRAQKIIERAVRRRKFLEVRELNTELSRLDKDEDELHSFVFAVNKPELNLWRVDSYGNLKISSGDKAIDYVRVGSGKEQVDKYIEEVLENEKFDRDNITTTSAIKIGRGAIRAAEKDKWSGYGYDLVILTKKEIITWGKEIQQELEEADNNKIDKICNYYEPDRNEEEQQ